MEDDRELVCRLMAQITGRFEDATGLAVAGQNPRHPPEEYAALARNIIIATDDLAILARAAEALARNGAASDLISPDQR